MTDIEAVAISGQSQPAKAAMAYRRDIDGLRAIAVTTVVLFHAGAAWLPGGFIGVDIFFVISGFLIGGIIDRSVRNGNFSSSSFYARRARRILPALLFVIAVSLGIGALILAPHEQARLFITSVTSIVGISNIYFFNAIDYFNPAAEFDPMLMTWSLGVEEQFYIFVPIIFILMRTWTPGKRIAAIASLCAFSLVLSIGLTFLRPQAAFYLLPTRAWELGAGVLLALVRDGVTTKAKCFQEPLSVFGLAAIIASVLLLSPEDRWPGYLALVPVIGSMALLVTSQSVINRRILGSTPFVAVGLISYSWYLWHWPLLVFLRIGAAGNPLPGALLVVALASLVLAVMSWRFVEQPFRHPSSTDSITLKRYALVLVAAVSVGVFGWKMALTGHWSQPQIARIDSEIANYQNFACLTGALDIPRNRACGTHEQSQPTVAILGDSHAGALARGLMRAGSRRGSTVAVLTKHSCRPLYGLSLAKTEAPGYAASCEAFMRQAYDYVAAEKSIKTVVLAGLWTLGRNGESLVPWDDGADATSQELLAQGVTASVARLRAAGKSVIIVEDTPYWLFDPSQVALAQINSMRHAVFAAGSKDAHSVKAGTGIAKKYDAANSIVADAAIRAKADLLRTRTIFCDPPEGARCRFADEAGNPFFNDRSHLSQSGADLVVAQYADRIFDN